MAKPRHDYSASEAAIRQGEDEYLAWVQKQRRAGRPPERDDDLPEGPAFPEDSMGVVAVFIPPRGGQ